MPLFHSLRARVLFWISVALTILFVVTIFGLDVAFRTTADDSIEELLEVQLLGLIALAQETPDQELALPADAMFSPQLGVADSGLYGILWDADGVPVWQSASLLDREFTVPVWPLPGERYNFMVENDSLPLLHARVEGVTWPFSDGSSLPYTFGVAVSLAPYDQRQAAFRRNLIGWFAGITLTMLVVLTSLLTFMLLPVRRLERQVREVEGGRRTELSVSLPSELVGLAGNLNALISTERRRLVRYRNTLDDLAHSLKTPLAAIRTLLSDKSTSPGELSLALDKEVERIDQRVTHQLRRARASGATGIGTEPVNVGPVIQDLVETLDKVYRDKQVSCELDISRDAHFRGDEGDLSELLGNLLDNAYKYCRRVVHVRAWQNAMRLCVSVADDGPGIDASMRDELLERGARADESIPGQGIGLAVVYETVALYDGELRFGSSSLGGLDVQVELGRPGFSA